MIHTKIIGEHGDGCFAMLMVENGQWENPWNERASHELRSADGRLFSDGSGRTTVWFKFSCNDSKCEAKLLLKAEDVMCEALWGLHTSSQ